jgi:hypothetical protein
LPDAVLTILVRGSVAVIERRPDALGFGAVECSSGLIDGIPLQDQTLGDGGRRCVRRRNCRLVLGNRGTVIAVASAPFIDGKCPSG